MQLQGIFTSAGETDLADDTETIINDLVNIRDVQLGAIESNVDLLEEQVDQLSTHIDTVVVSTYIHTAVPAHVTVAVFPRAWL